MHVKEICYETTEKVKPLCHCAWEKTGIHGGHKLRRSPLSLSAQLGEYGRRSATTTPRRITEIPELSSKYDTNVSGLIMNSFASFGCFCASTYLETFGQVLKVHTNTPVLHWAVYTAKSLSFCKQVRTAGLGELSSLSSHNMRNGEKKRATPRAPKCWVPWRKLSFNALLDIREEVGNSFKSRKGWKPNHFRYLNLISITIWQLLRLRLPGVISLQCFEL